MFFLCCRFGLIGECFFFFLVIKLNDHFFRVVLHTPKYYTTYESQMTGWKPPQHFDRVVPLTWIVINLKIIHETILFKTRTEVNNKRRTQMPSSIKKKKKP